MQGRKLICTRNSRRRGRRTLVWAPVNLTPIDQNQLFVSLTDAMAHREIRGLSRSALWGSIVGEGSLGRSPLIELQGIDGRLYFFDEHTGSGKTKQIIFSVKAGHIGPAPIRDLWGVVERETAQIGVLISMEEPTKAMRTEVAKAGFYERPSGGKDERYPRLQLLTIEELLKGKGIAYPAFRANVTFKKAPKAEEERTEARLPFDE